MKTQMPRARKPYNQTKAYWRKERDWLRAIYGQSEIPQSHRERFTVAMQEGFLDDVTEQWVLDEFPFFHID